VVNLPFVQFLLDVAMVYTYWLMVTASGSAAAGSHRTATIAGLVAIAFALYGAWDLVSYRMGCSVKYSSRLAESDRLRRSDLRFRYGATAASLLATIGVWVVALDVRNTMATSLVIYAVIVLIAFGFRVAKDSKPVGTNDSDVSTTAGTSAQ
jgi:hypothetical protein